MAGKGKKVVKANKPTPPYRAERRIAFGIAVALAVGSWISHLDAQAYATGLFFGALALVLLGLLLPSLVKLEVTGTGVKVEMDRRERDASARAADEGVTPSDVAQDIASTDSGPPTASPEDAEIIGTLNYSAGALAVRAIFDWATSDDSHLRNCELRLYLYDEEVDRLVPSFYQGGDEVRPPKQWEIGRGATGAAYETGAFVCATGPAVSDDTYDLTDEEQERYRQLAAVGSAPVFNSAGTTIGVLTASTSDLNHQLGSQAGEQELTAAALLVSRVLVELLQWFDDE